MLKTQNCIGIEVILVMEQKQEHEDQKLLGPGGGASRPWDAGGRGSYHKRSSKRSRY